MESNWKLDVVDILISNGYIFNHLPFDYARQLTNNREAILYMVKLNGNCLSGASESLQDDREIVLAAVKTWGWTLVNASERLKNDKEIVLEALKRHTYVLHQASEQLRNDPQMQLAAQSKEYLEVLLEAVKSQPKEIT